MKHEIRKWNGRDVNVTFDDYDVHSFIECRVSFVMDTLTINGRGSSTDVDNAFVNATADLEKCILLEADGRSVRYFESLLSKQKQNMESCKWLVRTFNIK